MSGCRALLELESDPDSGEGKCSFVCDLPEGHRDEHESRFTVARAGCVIVYWEKDVRPAPKRGGKKR